MGIIKNKSRAFNVKNQYGLAFDGVNEYMTILDNSVFSFTDGAGADLPFSFSCWVKINSFGTGSWLINKRGATQSTQTEWQVTVGSAGAVTFALFGGGGITSYIYITTNTNLSLNSWALVTCVYNGNEATAGLSIYFNGANQAVTPTTGGVYTGMSNTTADVVIGKMGWTSGGYFNGSIDEVSIFNTALTATQVKEIYNSGKPTNLKAHSAAANLVAWYRLGDYPDSFSTNWTLVNQGSAVANGTSVNMEVGDRTTGKL